MRFEESLDDEPFFRERMDPVLGEKRSKSRAHELAESLGVLLPPRRPVGPWVVTVVGSKGKGTTATYASATLSAAGLRVGTLTSPGYRTNRERIRVQGQAITPSEYHDLSQLLGTALERLGPRRRGDGYLSPTGLFTIAAWTHFRRSACDVWVCEAGMGGRSDEVSLLAPDVVGITEIFGEHLGILGNTILEIAADKLGVIVPVTRVAVALPQSSPGVTDLLESVAGERLVIIDNAENPVESWHPLGLSRMNASLGIAVGRQALDAIGHEQPTEESLDAVLSTVRLPGRLSVHEHSGKTWVVDSAINNFGVSQALACCEQLVGSPATLLACIPDGKDQVGVKDVLRNTPHTRLRCHAQNLTFNGWNSEGPYIDELSTSALASPILALGTISFIGEVLGELNVSLESSYMATSTMREMPPKPRVL
jgi:folylpolyglutamate synthase/dihydrofolate synthase